MTSRGRKSRETFEEVGPRFERIELLVQRALSAVILALPCLALLGLLGGHGPLNATTRKGPGGTSVGYDRVARRGGQTVVRIEGAEGGPLRVDESYLSAFDVERITPQPLAERREGGSLLFEFAQPGPSVVELRLSPCRSGRAEGRVATGNDSVAIRTIVLP
jgi:hypothetical protein